MPVMTDRAHLLTELRLPESMNLDAMSTAEAVAVMNAQDAKAVAAGIREGWSRDKPLDLNTATKEQLLTLPGMTPVQADRVIAKSPYNEPGELVTRHIMPKLEYDKIADRLTVKK